MNPIDFVCPSGTNDRVDKVLSLGFPDHSRSAIRRSIEEGRTVLADGTRLEPKSKVRSGDHLLVDLSRPTVRSLEPCDCHLEVIHEDDHLIVINKAAGMVVHPGDGTDERTLVHALLHHCREGLSPLGAPLRPGVVHRLDKETSGVMVVAKTERAHLSLAEQFAERSTVKIYRALVSGSMIAAKGVFGQPIGRHPKVRVKMAVSEKGKKARTNWEVITRFGEEFCLVECRIETGRTHQIRVHFSASGHPLCGDSTYGYKLRNHPDHLFPRVMLHARTLSFLHPATGETVCYEASIPDDFKHSLKALSQEFGAEKPSLPECE